MSSLVRVVWEQMTGCETMERMQLSLKKLEEAVSKRVPVQTVYCRRQLLWNQAGSIQQSPDRLA